MNVTLHLAFNSIQFFALQIDYEFLYVKVTKVYDLIMMAKDCCRSRVQVYFYYLLRDPNIIMSEISGIESLTEKETVYQGICYKTHPVINAVSNVYKMIP